MICTLQAHLQIAGTSSRLQHYLEATGTTCRSLTTTCRARSNTVSADVLEQALPEQLAFQQPMLQLSEPYVPPKLRSQQLSASP